MKTAEEILKEHTGHAHGLMNHTQILAMKAYAKQVAEQSLKDASENATFEIIEVAFMEEEVRINKQSILQTEIKLP